MHVLGFNSTSYAYLKSGFVGASLRPKKSDVGSIKRVWWPSSGLQQSINYISKFYHVGHSLKRQEKLARKYKIRENKYRRLKFTMLLWSAEICPSRVRDLIKASDSNGRTCLSRWQGQDCEDGLAGKQNDMAKM